MGQEQRRDIRYQARYPVVLRSGKRAIELHTEDVSLRGLFIRTDSPPPLRQLLQVEIALPPEGVQFKSHGMTVFAIQPSEAGDRVPGVGIQFYAMGAGSGEWQRFVEWVREELESRATTTRPPQLDDAEPIRRLFPRHDVVVAVTPQSIDELYVMYTRDVSKGGMFLTTEQPLAVGTPLRLDVHHPETDDVFPISCVVRRSDSEGVAVEFEDMTGEAREAFYEFVYVGISSMADEDVVLVDEGDPALA